MEALTLRTLVEVQSHDRDNDPTLLPATPAKTASRTHRNALDGEAGSTGLQRIDTKNIHRPNDDGTKQPRDSKPPARAQSPAHTPTISGSDLEMSRPSSPVATEVLQSIADPYMNRFRLAASSLILFGHGLNDSAPGALIPYMEKHYNIGYAVVSLIFVGNACGFIFGAILLESLRHKLGRARLLALAQSLITFAYVPILFQAPFPVIVLSFFMTGFGMSLNLAIVNVFCGSLQQATAALGFLHGAYGIGGTIGPLVATALVTRARARWSTYYFFTLGLACVNGVFATWSYWNYERELPHSQQHPTDESTSARLLSLFSALKTRIVALGALFIFAYQGAEVSISGWVISFLITERDGDPDAVGYVTSGFWAGITLGRFLLSHPAARIGEKPAVFIATGGAAVFQLLVWWVPNVVGPAVSVAFVGLLLGPIYACAAATFMRGMTRHERVGGMGVISAFASSGGAVAPFATGLVAQTAGAWVLHPIAIGLFVVMLATWFGIPHARKRSV